MSTTVKHPLGFKSDDLSINELFGLADVLGIFAEMVGAFREQPRFSEYGNGDGGYNEVGWLLDDFRDRIVGEIRAIRRIAEARPALTQKDYDRKFYLLAHGYLSGTDRPGFVISEFSRIANEMGDRP
jgi:hypothetical protein